MHVYLTTCDCTFLSSQGIVCARSLQTGMQCHGLVLVCFRVCYDYGQSPAAICSTQRSTVAESTSEIIKSLKRENKEILLKLSVLEQQNTTILQELRKLQETSFAVKGSTFEVYLHTPLSTRWNILMHTVIHMHELTRYLFKLKP